MFYKGLIDTNRNQRLDTTAPLLRQKSNGRRKKSINTRVFEFSTILKTVVYYKLTTNFTTQ